VSRTSRPGDLRRRSRPPLPSANQLLHEGRAGSFQFNTTYSYDPAGNRTLRIDSGVRTTSTYDAANQCWNELRTRGTAARTRRPSCFKVRKKRSITAMLPGLPTAAV
jgi:YD repeat-containing protein